MHSLWSISKSQIKAALLAGVLLLGIGQSWAQVVRQDSSTGDPFSSFHASLNSAADRTLSASVQPPVEASRNALHQHVVTPEDINSKVAGQAAAINRVQQLRPILEPILREEGVPPELTAVVLVESGGQLNALSRKGARGIWQFVPDTARRYGLIVSRDRDERLDILRSTRAAARYLRDLYGQFGDWRLTFAAYNAGEGLVQHAIDRHGTRDFSQLSIARSLPLETVKYVPAVLDATRIITPNSAILPFRNGTSSWRVYAGSQPNNGK